MGRNYMLLLILCWSIIVVIFAATDSEVTVNPGTGLDPKIPSSVNNSSNLNGKTGGLKSELNSTTNEVDQAKKGNDQLGGSKEGEDGLVGKGEKKNDDHQIEKKDEDGSVGEGENEEGDQVEKKDEDGSLGKGGNKEGLSEEGKGDNKEGLSEGSESKEETKEVPKVRKEGSRGEECDVSSSCKAEKNALIACLRVPGNDSPDLSLLIQNKGNDPLSVAISAPNFVQLEKTQVQLRQKEDIKAWKCLPLGGVLSSNSSSYGISSNFGFSFKLSLANATSASYAVLDS